MNARVSARMTVVARRPPAPAKDRLGAVMRGALPHDMLNMHFYGVFRKVELDGNQLVGKAELQRREYVLLAGREGRSSLSRQNRRGAVPGDRGLRVSSVSAGVCVLRYGMRIILSHDR